MSQPAPPPPPAVVIGIGNEFRRDDGAGPQVVARLRDRVPGRVRFELSDGEPVRLIEAWAGAELAVVVDAVRADPAQAGRIHRVVIDPVHAAAGPNVSSHGLGLAEAVGLACELDLMPGRLIVHAVEAADFRFGLGLSPAVAAAADALAEAVLADLGAAAEPPAR